MSTLKKHTLASIGITPVIDGLTDNQVILVTAAGVITGSPVTKEDINVDSDPKKFFISKMAKEFSDSYRKDNNISAEEILEGNDGFLLLKNATLHSADGTPFNFKELIVFYDEIIATSLGNFS